ncbi:Interferon-related developmental regulator family protein [Rhynchospora pubera]|uniref:Interferon-related developmental regulator family protein n=1 Tax=Rhynchospora pubera TaxID=906938 RepID=A0AAV8HBV9_9POAL|nr:Interferon-related developmental regulator family protein [Rhynchospora pubera]
MPKGYKKKKGCWCPSDFDDSTAMSDSTSVDINEDFIFDTPLDELVDNLYAKRSVTRENALVEIVDSFESDDLLSFVENQYITISYLFINSIKKGMTKETNLACRAIGLLSFTVGGGTGSHEIMKEALPQLCKILSGSDQSKIPAVVKCIGLLAFLGADDLDETEVALEAIWKIIQPKTGNNVTTVKYEPPVVVAAITAWTFLLTTISTWRINQENWTKYILDISNLLEADDRTVRMAAGEAIALFFELKLFDVKPAEEDAKYFQRLTYMNNMKAKVTAQIDALSCEASHKGANKKNRSAQRELFGNIWDYVMNGGDIEETVKMSSRGTILCISSWAELIQLNFIKHFLRKGFHQHAQYNPLMREIFTLDEDEIEYLPNRVKKIHRSKSKRRHYMQIKKERDIAEARKQSFFNELIY